MKKEQKEIKTAHKRESDTVILVFFPYHALYEHLCWHRRIVNSGREKPNCETVRKSEVDFLIGYGTGIYMPSGIDKMNMYMYN